MTIDVYRTLVRFDNEVECNKKKWFVDKINTQGTATEIEFIDYCQWIDSPGIVRSEERRVGKECS